MFATQSSNFLIDITGLFLEHMSTSLKSERGSHRVSRLTTRSVIFNELTRAVLPDIGFMSELMRFEERALGTKSSGVNLTSSLPTSGPSSKPPTATRSVSSVGDPGRGMSAQNESAWGRLRDSMPPMNTSPTDTLEFGQLFSGDREQEVKGHKCVRFISPCVQC